MPFLKSLTIWYAKNGIILLPWFKGPRELPSAIVAQKVLHDFTKVGILGNILRMVTSRLKKIAALGSISRSSK